MVVAARGDRSPYRQFSKQFRATHGREPIDVVAIALAQQATLESREAKPEPRSLAEQHHTWRTEAIEVSPDPDPE